MRKKLISFFLVLFLAQCFLGLIEADARKAKIPARDAGAAKGAVQTPGQAKAAGGADAPIQANSKSAVLVEVSSGTPIFEQNPDMPIEPASFTKIMTLYLVFDALQKGLIHLDDEVYISKLAWGTGGSKMFVGVGTKIPLEEIIKGIAVVSGNDACIAAAEHVSGSVEAFVAAMNDKAKELGMTNSTFMNPNGLPVEGQITTARDMAKLMAAYLQRFPQSLRFHSMREYTYNNITQNNRNHLLFKDDTIDGLKTGFVSAAGYHLAATSQREGMRLLAVVMGAVSPHVREVEALKLLSYGYHKYAMMQPFAPDTPVATLKLWKGVKDELPVYPVERVSLMVPRGQKNAVKWEVHVPQDAVAPVKAGQSFGDVVLYLDGTPQKTISLVSKEDVAQAGFFKRAWHTVFRLHTVNWIRVGEIAGGTLLGIVILAFVFTRRPFARRRPRGI